MAQSLVSARYAADRLEVKTEQYKRVAQIFTLSVIRISGISESYISVSD